MRRNLIITGSNNGLAPTRCQAIIQTKAGILLIGPLGTNFSEILIKIHTFSFRKMHLEMSGKWRPFCLCLNVLTHWGRVTHIGVGKLTIIGSDNGLSPEWRQAIIWTNAWILLIGPLWTNFCEILIEIPTFSLKKIRLKMSSAKCCSFRLGLNVLIRTNMIFQQVHLHFFFNMPWGISPGGILLELQYPVIVCLQFLWRSGTRRLNLGMPGLPMNCSNLTDNIYFQSLLGPAQHT